MRRTPSDQPEESTQRTPLDWLVRVAAPLLGLTGAVLYGVLRLSYLTFYLQVRATPEEVGYGYVEILATQLIGAIELVLFVMVLIFLGVLVSRYVTGMARALRHAGWPGPRFTASRENLLRVAGRSAIAAVVLVVVLLPCIAWLYGAEAKKGFAVRNVYPQGFIVLPVLAVQAVPAKVEWVSETAPASIENRECLLYLGANDGTAVFYDVHTEESLRLPTSAISVTLPLWYRTPGGCYPPPRD
jgi:cbb3-type cytochrome oxidase subunit 3